MRKADNTKKRKGIAGAARVLRVQCQKEGIQITQQQAVDRVGHAVRNNEKKRG